MLEEIQGVEKECQKRRQELFACEHESNETLKSLEISIRDAKGLKSTAENEVMSLAKQIDTLKREARGVHQSVF